MNVRILASEGYIMHVVHALVLSFTHSPKSHKSQVSTHLMLITLELKVCNLQARASPAELRSCALTTGPGHMIAGSITLAILMTSVWLALQPCSLDCL